ncbi:hypothetical protein EBZ37_10865 [bacterium]|nr:hypothetical protein [bacterium]
MTQSKQQLQVFERVSIEARSIMLDTTADFEPLLCLSGSCDLQSLVIALQDFTRELTSYTGFLQKL